MVFNFAFMTAIIILSVLIVLVFFGLLITSTMRMWYLEKEVDVVDHVPVYDPEESLSETIVGYEPIVKFEIDGKSYGGKVRVRVDREKDKTVKILYDPSNPGDFVSESSAGTMTGGCVMLVLLLAGLGIAIFLHLHS